MNSEENSARRRYCKKIQRNLVCSSETKKELVSGLENELLESELNHATYEELVAGYGEPGTIANQLMEAVDEAERAQAIKRRKVKRCAAMLLFVLVIIGAVLGYLHYLSNGAITQSYTGPITEIDVPEDNIIWETPKPD